MKKVEVYDRILSVTAAKRDGSRWRHKFSGRARILGGADGSLTVKGAKPLWKRVPFKGKREPFLVNPPGKRGYFEERRDLVKTAIKAPRHRLAALQGWLFRERANPWHEEKEWVDVPIRRAPKHRAAAVAAYEQGERERVGYHRPTKKTGARRAEPEALRLARLARQRADYDELQDSGKYQGEYDARTAPAYRQERAGNAAAYYGNPPDPRVDQFRRRVLSGRRAGGLSLAEKAELTREIRAAGLAGSWGDIFGHEFAGAHKPAMRRQAGLFAEGARDQGNLFNNPPRQTAQAKRAAKSKRGIKMARRKHHSRRRKGVMPAGLRAYWAGKRRGGHKLRANPPKRHKSSRRRRGGGGGRGGRISIKELAINSGAVLAGIGLPAVALRTPAIAGFAKEKWQRILLKSAAGYGLSMLARKFVGRRAGEMVLVGTGVGVALDLLPQLAPAVGLGLSDAYDPDQGALTSVGEMIPAGIAEMLSGYGGGQNMLPDTLSGNELDLSDVGEMIPIA
jgi:hypothetical protein